MLTHPSVLAAHAHANQTSPVRRGRLRSSQHPLHADPSPAAQRRYHAAQPRPQRDDTRAFRSAYGRSDLRDLPSDDGPHRLWLRRVRRKRQVPNDGERQASRRVRLGRRHRRRRSVQRRASSSYRTARQRAGQELRVATLARVRLAAVPVNEDACSLEQAQNGFSASGYNLRDLDFVGDQERRVSLRANRRPEEQETT